ncbi:MAG: 4Fe-4S binding protein [Clostridia bacterium]|nr:4Fe-4S binding protein [Clostridia bacterium]
MELPANPFNLEIADKDLAEKLEVIYRSPLWRELQEKCVNCGVCTFLCPTCHCFDLTDDQKGKKVRSWDSCMFASFTKQASGHNPRPTGAERLRQRVMHKFRYFFENHGIFACVGCGRCVEKCPVNLDIREVLQRIKEVQ